MHTCTILLALAVLLPTTVFGGSSSALTYACNPAGAIIVQNPESTIYLHAVAYTADESLNCTVDFINNNEAILIGGCPVSTNITLWLFNTATLPTIVTADSTQFHVINCQQISDSGIFRKVTDDSWVTNLQLSTTVLTTVTPRIILETQLEDIESGIERTTAIVGEPLLWDIEGPVGYVILPLKCTVSSGAGIETMIIVVNGCSQDTYLMDHFRYLSPTEKHILQANLYAFRFLSSEEVIIECDMLGCVGTSTACDFSCPGRRRRQFVGNHFQHPTEGQSGGQPVTQPTKAQDFYRDETVQPSDIVGHVRTTLRVFDFKISNSAPTNFASWTSGFLLVVTSLLSAVDF